MEPSKLACAKSSDGIYLGAYVSDDTYGTGDDAEPSKPVLRSGSYDSTSSGPVTSSDPGTEPTECAPEPAAPCSAHDAYAEFATAGHSHGTLHRIFHRPQHQQVTINLTLLQNLCQQHQLKLLDLHTSRSTLRR